MRVRSTVLSAALAAATALLAVPAASAAPVTIGCGAVVDRPVVLTADLVCRRSPVGLTLDDGADLDLNGFRLVGGDGGVALMVPSDGDVTVRGGTIVGWRIAVSEDEGPDDVISGPLGTTTVQDVTFRRTTAGVSVDAMSSVAPRVDVVASRFVDVPSVMSGSYVHLTLTSSHVTGGGLAVWGGGTVTVVDSVIAGSPDAALSCEEAGCIVRDSVLRDNKIAVEAYHFGTVSVHNSTLVRNETGVTVQTIALQADLVGNVLRDNGTAVRIFDSHAHLVGNRFVGNDVGYEGLWSSSNTLIQGNEFRRNGDGILSVAEGSELQDNLAVNNERWGIHAPGAIDLGGNTARGNGNEPQCVGVVCGGTGPVS